MRHQIGKSSAGRTLAALHRPGTPASCFSSSANALRAGYTTIACMLYGYDCAFGLKGNSRSCPTIRLLKVHGAAFLDRVVSGLLTVDRLWLLVVLVLQASNQILRS